MNARSYSHQEQRSVSNVYALLSRLWLAEVDEPLLSELSTPPLSDSWLQIGGVIPKQSELDSLAVEYCRLFIGPRDHLPPIQSVWQRAQLQSEVTDSVQAFAEVFGYDMPRQHNGIVDHLGIELDMMAHVLSTGDASSDASAAAAEFFNRHLTWPDKLLSSASEQATSPFYQSLIQITQVFLRSESTTIATD